MTIDKDGPNGDRLTGSLVLNGDILDPTWLLARINLAIDAVQNLIAANERLLEIPGHEAHARQMIDEALLELGLFRAEKAHVEAGGYLTRAAVEQLQRDLGDPGEATSG